jgi:hypothetical protein
MIDETSVLDKHVNDVERALMAPARALETEFNEMPWRTDVEKTRWARMSENIKRTTRRIKAGGEYKIMTILRHYGVVHASEGEEEAMNWLENDLAVYMIGFENLANTPAKRRAYASKSAALFTPKSRSKNIALRIKTAEQYMMERMSLRDIDGFIRMQKSIVIHPSIPQCKRTSGPFKREQWVDVDAPRTSTRRKICVAVSPTLPEDPSDSEYLRLLLREIAEAWPGPPSKSRK